MSLHIFQSFWYGAALSPYEWMCIRSFLDHGHAYHLYSYDGLAVPAGCIVMDAAEILPREQVFVYRDGGSVSAFSNWFRYKLLHARGGWWVDTDMACISDTWPDAPRQVGYEDRGAREAVNGAVIRAEPGDPMMAEAFRIAAARGQDVAWGQIGPKLVTQLVATGTYDYKVWGEQAFYPIHYDAFPFLFRPEFATLDELRQLGAVGVHLWNENFRLFKISKTAAPPAQSLLWQLFDRAGLLGMFAEQYLYDAGQKRLDGPVPTAAITPELTERMLQLVRQAPL